MTLTTTPLDSVPAAGSAHRLLDRAHERAVRAQPPQMAAFLQELIGQRWTAVMVGIGDPKAIGKWARGERSPRGEAVERLRDAYQVATLLSSVESPATVRAWLLGMNPYLGDRSPAAVIGGEPDGAERAMRAARAFLANG